MKLWVVGWLHGSIRWQMTPEERGVWADILALAGECNQDGAICDHDNKPYPMDYMAGQLNIPLQLLENVVGKCVNNGQLSIDSNKILYVSNWSIYQSEYDRQKKYRKKPAEAPGLPGIGAPPGSEQNDGTGEVYKAFESEIGVISPMMKEKLDDLVKNFPKGWITLAIEEAVKHNVRNFAYVEKILNTWKTKGMKSGKPGNVSSTQDLKETWGKQDDL